MNIFLLSLLLTAPTGSTTEQSTPQIAPLRNAHAHNDYRHQRPLLDALDQGFCSVEADIFLADGKLLVGHDRQELTPDRTLQSLYLDPLRRPAAAGNGRVFPDGPSITLLIDIKSDGATTYAALRTVLAEYAEILTTVQGEKLTPRAVTVVISGNRAEDKIANDTLRYAGIDGRLGDLNSDSPAHLVPLISDNWTRHFS